MSERAAKLGQMDAGMSRWMLPTVFAVIGIVVLCLMGLWLTVMNALERAAPQQPPAPLVVIVTPQQTQVKVVPPANIPKIRTLEPVVAGFCTSAKFAELLRVAPAGFMKPHVFEQLTGYSQEAVHTKIKRRHLAGGP